MVTQEGLMGSFEVMKKIIDAFKDFWEIYTTEKITFRDQPMWGYILQKHNIKPFLYKIPRA